MSFVHEHSFNGNLSDEALNSFDDDSMGMHTDSSFVPTPTTRSIATLTSNLTEAPKKFASSINHHLSNIIYSLCRTIERKVKIEADEIKRVVGLENLDREKYRDIIDNLFNEVVFLFITSAEQSTLSLIR